VISLIGRSWGVDDEPYRSSFPLAGPIFFYHPVAQPAYRLVFGRLGEGECGDGVGHTVLLRVVCLFSRE
jgi:hypothetical protein